MTYTIYVNANISEDGNFAACTYSLNADGTGPVDGADIHIPVNAGECAFAQADDTYLSLIGATFKTIGSASGMNSSNFAPANDEHVVALPMPTSTTVTKGVVLLFSTPGIVENLYPSSDPQVTNDTSACP